MAGQTHVAGTCKYLKSVMHVCQQGRGPINNKSNMRTVLSALLHTAFNETIKIDGCPGLSTVLESIQIESRKLLRTCKFVLDKIPTMALSGRCQIASANRHNGKGYSLQSGRIEEDVRGNGWFTDVVVTFNIPFKT